MGRSAAAMMHGSVERVDAITQEEEKAPHESYLDISDLLATGTSREAIEVAVRNLPRKVVIDVAMTLAPDTKEVKKLVNVYKESDDEVHQECVRFLIMLKQVAHENTLVMAETMLELPVVRKAPQQVIRHLETVRTQCKAALARIQVAGIRTF